MSFDGINIVPSEDTKSKIAAYAVLSRQNVDEVIGQLEGLINNALKEKCIELLGGNPYAEAAEQIENQDPGVTYSVTFPPTKDPAPVPTKTFAAAHKATAASPPLIREPEIEHEVEAGSAGAPQHELSSDEDSQNNKSLEEQVADEDPLPPEEEEAFKLAFAGKNGKNVGDNVEAFLDGVAESPDDTDEIPAVTRGYAGQGLHGERPAKASKTFESRLRKGQGARVSYHTGEED
jgi:hypothetical protein